MFANSDARGLRGNRRKFTAGVVGSLRFRIKRIDVRQAARQVDQQNRFIGFVGAARFGLCAYRRDIGYRQPQQPQAPNLNRLAAIVMKAF